MSLNVRNVKWEYLQLQLQILGLKFCIGLLYNVYKRVTNYTLPLPLLLVGV